MAVQLSDSYNEACRYIIPSEGLEVRADSTPVNPVVASVYKTRICKELAKQARQVFKEVAKRVMVYQAAFAGGTRPIEVRVNLRSEFRFVSLDGLVLDDAVIDGLAWAYVPVEYDYQTREYTITNTGKAAADKLWRDVYQTFGVKEVYKVELPLGRVS